MAGYGRWALLVYDDLGDAIRRESATAIQHYWGVGQDTVWR